MRIADAAKFEVMPITEGKSLNCNEAQVQGQHNYRAKCANEENSRVTEFSKFQKSVKEIQTVSLENLSALDFKISIKIKSFTKFAKNYSYYCLRKKFRILDGLKLFEKSLQKQLPLNWVISLFKTAKGERSGNCGGAKGNHRKKQRKWE